jgi:hypothetical protein
MSLILHDDHLVTMIPNNEVISDGAVLISPDGRIQAVGEATTVMNANPGTMETRRHREL